MNKTVMIDATPDVVWDYLTDADKLASWFFQSDADLAEGAAFTLRGEDGDGRAVKKCWGEVLEMDPPKRLVYSFTISPLNGHMTRVTWELEAVSGGTRLTLTHDGLDDQTTVPGGIRDALDVGWGKHLESLLAAASSDTLATPTS